MAVWGGWQIAVKRREEKNKGEKERYTHLNAEFQRTARRDKKAWAQSLSHVRLFETLWIAECQSSLSITSSWSLFKLMSIELMMPSNHLILCCPLLLLPSIFPRVFSNKLVFRIRWPKYWEFHFNISPSNEYLGLISFTMDWLDLLAVQGTLKSLLQHHSSKASIVWCSAFLQPNSHIHTWPLEKPWLWLDGPLLAQ